MGFYGISGVKTGRLSELTSWRIEPIRNGFAVLPPRDRVAALKNLKSLGYMFGVNRSDAEEVKRIRREELERYKLHDFVRMRELGRTSRRAA